MGHIHLYFLFLCVRSFSLKYIQMFFYFNSSHSYFLFIELCHLVGRHYTILHTLGSILGSISDVLFTTLMNG